MTTDRQDFDESIPHLMGTTKRALHLQMCRRLAEAKIDLSAEQIVILAHLQQEDNLPQSFFVDLLLRDKTYITRQIDDLEQRGLVRRVHDEIDRRQKLVCLLPAGQKFMRPVRRIMEQVLARAVRGIDPAEITLFKRNLRKIAENLHE